MIIKYSASVLGTLEVELLGSVNEILISYLSNISMLLS